MMSLSALNAVETCVCTTPERASPLTNNTKMDNIRIALDVMGGDRGPEVTISGAARVLKERSNISFLLYGDEGKIRPYLSRYPALQACSEVFHTDKFISNEEKPSVALRKGRESSMRLAINAVAEGRADCIVSSGNTGALMVMAKMVLKCLPGINRPAIASVFPTMKEDTIMLDLGANLACDSEMLVQFAVLGAVYAKVVRNIQDPRVGLLNIGSEDMKGPEQVRAAALVLNEIKMPGHFYGYVEGNDIPKGTVDVVVTDGFSGNIALKIAEGVGALSDYFVKKAFKSSFIAMIGGLLASKAIRRVQKKIDPRLYNGGMFLGLDGVCVKSHGGSDDVGFANAIKVAADLVYYGFNTQVSREIDQLMNQESFFTIGTGKAL